MTRTCACVADDAMGCYKARWQRGHERGMPSDHEGRCCLCACHRKALVPAVHVVSGTVAVISGDGKYTAEAAGAFIVGERSFLEGMANRAAMFPALVDGLRTFASVVPTHEHADPEIGMRCPLCAPHRTLREAEHLLLEPAAKVSA